MARSGVLRGQPVPRSRAKLRGRLDAKHGRYRRKALREFIDGWLPKAREVDSLLCIDLRDFLRASARMGGEDAERLRQLAIFIEEDCAIAQMPRGWQPLKRIYALATELAPDDEHLWQSVGISALACAQAIDDPKLSTPLWREARDAAARAARLAPNNPNILYSLGYQHYFAPTDEKRAALDCFERAAALDPHHGWAQLYLAHCLHDLERWQEAAHAYACVHPGAFSRHQLWRLDLARQQRAQCLLQAGKRAEAVALLRLVIERYQLLEPPQGGLDWYDVMEVSYPPQLLFELGTTTLEPELGEAVRALAERVGFELET